MQGKGFLPETSASLAGRRKAKGQQWLSKTKPNAALFSAILSVIHPEQRRAGIQTLKKIAENVPKTSDAIKQWSCAFSALQVISNRQTPRHRDIGAPKSCYDLLATTGNYTSAHFEFTNIGVNVPYRPGTVIALCGRVLRHAVSPFRGERTVHAYFMKESVLKFAGEGSVGWMNRSVYY